MGDKIVIIKMGEIGDVVNQNNFESEQDMDMDMDE